MEKQAALSKKIDDMRQRASSGAAPGGVGGADDAGGGRRDASADSVGVGSPTPKQRMSMYRSGRTWGR